MSSYSAEGAASPPAIVSPAAHPARRSRAERDRLVLDNLGLAYAVANQHAHRQDWDDIVQEGVIALMRSAELFNEDLGFAFSTYATWAIRRRVQLYLARASVIALPSHLGREQTEALHARLAPLSIHAPGDYDRADAFEPGVIDADQTEGADDRDRLYRLVALLPSRYARVITMRFGLRDGRPRKLDAIARAMGGVSRARAQQLVVRALQLLRILAARTGYTP